MSDRRPSKSFIDRIIGGGARIEASGPAQSVPDTSAVLAERVDLLVADFGRWESYKAASTEYITEFATEVRWHRRIRAAVACCGAALVLFLCIGLVIVLCWSQAIFGKDPGHALTALIVAAIGGSVVITIALIRGAFATLTDRNAGLPMPEHMKEIVEVGKSYFGKG